MNFISSKFFYNREKKKLSYVNISIFFQSQNLLERFKKKIKNTMQ